jgi:hypothetical protein
MLGPTPLGGEDGDALIKNKIKFSSYIRKFRWYYAKSYMTNVLLLIYD